jgi:hypothetical protein
VVGAEYPHLVGQQFAVQRQCASRVAHCPGITGEAEAGDQGVGMVGAEYPQSIVEEGLSEL